ncbi:putative quinol monooxygenase [Thermoactinospora rubra]|uniref:putative quinol monooxygenase n=1 Tax=Thermoactinospora rubra TaxID=1088767 RepID=UPI000A0FE6B7|nr:antibiotic biosynthesis monooxygenase [Thermoactinospora rubra]
MEILVAVLAFAGALLAAIAAGALARRLREEAEGWLIAWTVAAAGLALALGGVGVGSLVGFGMGTFKVFQLGGALLAPLWLGIGLVQLLAEKVPARFAAWLIGIASTVVLSVVVVFDPVSKTEAMTKSVPHAATHWPPIFAGYALAAAHVAVALVMVGAVVVAALRWRTGDDYDLDNLHATLVIAPSTLALLGAMRFSVPGIFTTALLLVAAAGIWYSVLRPLAPYEDEEEDDIQPEPAPRRTETPQPPQAPPVRPRRTSGLGDLVAEYRAADPLDSGPATGVFLANGVTSGEYGMTSGEYGRHGAPQPQPIPQQPIPQQPIPQPPLSQPQRPQHRQPDLAMPATGALFPGAEVSAAASRPSPSIYGLLTVFTLMDGAGAAFDRLAEETVEAVRRSEPDTLVYVCHGVKSAPLQRIVYELYRDEVAYADHQRQPHVERFVAERQSLVLATNVIELNVNAAKVMPLPTALF